MDKIIAYFQNLEQRPVERLIILVSGMLIFWIIEGAIPFYKLSFKKTRLKHAGINLTFTIIHLVIHTLFAIGIIAISDWCKANNFGIVQWIKMPIWLLILVTIIVMDFFVTWLVHLIEHKVKWMWRFHVIHHTDNNVDVTTGLRHHPVESVFRGVFMLIGVLVLGAPMYAVMMFQTIVTPLTAFTHANIQLPPKIDKLLSYILVSPHMHKIHHHYKLPYTDSNYGTVFSLWDRLFGMYKYLPKNEIKYGLDRYYPNEKDENLGELMAAPFKKMEVK